MDAWIDPDVAERVARTAEAAGFESLWAGEHVVLPEPRLPPSPMDPRDPILDPVVALTFLAAHTERMLLGTGIIILPQRNPLVLAKELASLDALSRGRLIVGIGAGYLEPEFRAIGVPLANRGRRTDEYLAAMQAIWSADSPAFSGRYVSFAGVQAYPRPVQAPHPPIVVGGHSPAAYERSVRCAHGWYGYGLDLGATAACLAGLREAAARVERPAALGPLEISVTPPQGKLDRHLAAAYADLGVHRLIVRPPYHLDATALLAYVAAIGDALIGR
jgi:probable F420-dependent oxidoreductase